MKDDFNNTLNFSYDGNGRLLQVVDGTGSGRSLTVTYDGSGRVGSIQDHTGRTVQYGYVSGKLDSVTDPAGRITHYSYFNGRFAPLLSEIKDHWNRIITTITYDGSDRMTSYTDAGEAYTMEYLRDWKHPEY